MEKEAVSLRYLLMSWLLLVLLIPVFLVLLIPVFLTRPGGGRRNDWPAEVGVRVTLPLLVVVVFVENLAEPLYLIRSIQEVHPRPEAKYPPGAGERFYESDGDEDIVDPKVDATEIAEATQSAK